MKLTTHFSIMPRLGLRKDKNLLPLFILMGRTGRAVYVSVGTVASDFADKILRRQLHRLSFKGLSKFVMRVSNETPISQCPSRAVMDKGG